MEVTGNYKMTHSSIDQMNTETSTLTSMFLYVRINVLINKFKSKSLPILAKLRHRKRASRASWVRFFGKSIHARNFGYDIIYVHPAVDCQGGGGEAGKPLETGLFRQFSLV